MRRHRRETETFSLSFLDVISCGFGAVILLLIVMLAFEPNTLRQISEGLRGLAAESRASREQIVAEQQELARDLAARKRDLARLEARLAALASDWEKSRRSLGAAQAGAEESARIEAQLEVVRQSLSEEMKRLLSQPEYRPPDESAVIGGIPIDSEYIVFVIDTSGSMKQGAWPLVVRKMQEVLDTYPAVKGIQVLSDVGTYMFPTYAGDWIPDSPGRRAVVVDRLRIWNTFSSSNPAPGILQAIRTFYRPDRPTSIFVFGDDFNGPSIDQVVRSVAALNRKSAAGQAQMRIHTFGFPVLPLRAPHLHGNFERFAHLMRILAEQNSGSFVGLNALP